MTPLQLVDNPQLREWDEFICARGGHLLQSSLWGDLKSRFGWSSHRVGLVRDHSLVAGAQILYRRLLPRLLMAYVPRGPVCDVQEDHVLEMLVTGLVQHARSQGAFMLKVEPDWLMAQSGITDLGKQLGACFSPGHAFQPRTSIHIDLTRDLDLILAEMKSKWRYNIRLAGRKGVTVRVGTKEDIPLFHQLLLVTSKRDDFAVHSLDYYHSTLELFGTRGWLRLFVAEYKGEPLAAIIVSAFGGEAIYLYGASGNMHRELMPNHILHWMAIQWAKERGCSHYDLWGVPDITRIDDTSLPNGLYQFKQGFGGRVVHYAGAYDCVLSPTRYAIYRIALAARQRS